MSYSVRVLQQRAADLEHTFGIDLKNGVARRTTTTAAAGTTSAAPPMTMTRDSLLSTSKGPDDELIILKTPVKQHFLQFQKQQQQQAAVGARPSSSSSSANTTPRQQEKTIIISALPANKRISAPDFPTVIVGDDIGGIERQRQLERLEQKLLDRELAFTAEMEVIEEEIDRKRTQLGEMKAELRRKEKHSGEVRDLCENLEKELQGRIESIQRILAKRQELVLELAKRAILNPLPPTGFHQPGGGQFSTNVSSLERYSPNGEKHQATWEEWEDLCEKRAHDASLEPTYHRLVSSLKELEKQSHQIQLHCLDGAAEVNAWHRSFQSMEQACRAADLRASRAENQVGELQRVSDNATRECSEAKKRFYRILRGENG